jgi:signal peptidase I
MYNTKEKAPKTFVAHVTEFIFLLVVVFLIRTIGFGLYQVPTGSMEVTMLVGERFFADKFTYLFRPPARGEIISFNEPRYQYSDNMIKNLFQQYVWGPDNWTKRVIGIPGDTVRGTIENGKPVVYLNGRKLDEPYLNPHPLIHVWQQDPEELSRQIEQELAPIIRGGMSEEMINRWLRQRWSGKETWRSYDSSVPFEKQYFYRINPQFIIYNKDGKPELREPQTPLSHHYKAEGLDAKRCWNETDQFYVELGPDEYWCMGDNRLGSQDCRFFGPIKQKFIHGRILFRIWSLDSDESWWIFDLLKNPIDFWKRVRWSRVMEMVF